MKGIKKVSTARMSREEWLQQRKHTIGGSDAAGIVGLSKWSSPYSVWADKTGRLPDKPDSEAMRLGRDLEEYVASRWTEATGKKVRRCQAMLYNPAYPFAHADVDRMVVGENVGLECKTTSTLDVKQFKGVDFPEQYYVQCVHYMAVTGADRWYLAVLVFGKGFFEFTLERDQEEIDALMGAEQDFWRLVEQDTPPTVDGKQATTEVLTTVWSGGGEPVQLFGRDAQIKEYLRLKAQKKELEEQIAAIENTIKQDMGDAERAESGVYAVSWKPQTRQTFQTKTFQAAHPEIDLTPYYKASTSRVFKIKEVETSWQEK